MKILAIDIGGTAIKSALADISNNDDIQLKCEKKTTFDNKNPSVSICNCIYKYSLDDFEYVAISATGVINQDGVVVSINGKIDNYLYLDIKNLVQSLTGKITTVINDVTAIGYAEIDQVQSDDISLVIALGTGIGGCLIYHNTILEGKSGAFAEIGQIKLGSYSYEELASTKALISRAQKSYNLKVENGIQFFEMLDLNPVYQACFDEWTIYLAQGIEQLLYCYNPNKIIIAGGISEQSDLIIPMLYKHLNQMNEPYIKNLEIKVASQKNNAGLIGAVKKLRRDVC